MHPQWRRERDCRGTQRTRDRERLYLRTLLIIHSQHVNRLRERASGSTFDKFPYSPRTNYVFGKQLLIRTVATSAFLWSLRSLWRGTSDGRQYIVDVVLLSCSPTLLKVRPIVDRSVDSHSQRHRRKYNTYHKYDMLRIRRGWGVGTQELKHSA